MNDAKPLASLSSSLLARKGHARPAMRPQSMLLNNGSAQSLEDLGWNDLGEVEDAQHKTHLATVNALTPMISSPAHEQQADLARHYESEEDLNETQDGFAEALQSYDWQADAFEGQSDVEASVGQPVLAIENSPAAVSGPASAAPTARAAPGSKAKAAFTLRLDPDRHMRLRLWAAVSHRSAQQIVTQALDEYLDRHAAANPFNAPVSAA